MKRLICASAVFAICQLSLSAASPESKLADAAEHQDVNIVNALLSTKIDVNVPQADGTTALMWIVRQDDLDLAGKLLRAGANSKPANRYGVTALNLACTNGDPKMIELLVKAGADVNAAGMEGETPLMTVARGGNVEAAKILLAHGANINATEEWRGQTALIWAVGQSHPDMVRLLLDHGADANLRTAQQHWDRQVTAEPREKWMPQGYLTPILFASRQGCLECAKLLVAKKADINAQDLEGVTPIISAIINGHYDVAGYLIDQGANVNAADKTGRTALYAAVDFHTMPMSNRPAPREIDNELSSLDIVKKLLDHGANVNAQLATQQPYRTKVDRGNDTMFNQGTTALLRAAKAGDTVVVKMLLDKGADAKLVNRTGINPLMGAAGLGTREEDATGRKKTEADAIDTIQLLLATGLDVNTADATGRTALFGSAIWGLDKVVRFLADHGAKLDLKDKKGFTALDAALGKAGGLGFDQATGTAHPTTAALLQDLLKGPSAKNDSEIKHEQ